MSFSATVIVPTYNRPQLLERSLRALLAQDPPPPGYQVIVVDDGSAAETGAAVQRAAGSDQRVSYLRHEINRGLSATRNTGVREARGDIVLFVDDDVVVEPGYVATHLAVHQRADPERIAVIGNLLFPPEVVAESNYAKYLQSRYLGGRRPETLASLHPSDLHPRFLIGAVCSMRRGDLLAVGMYDESIRFYGFEDHIFAHFLRQSGVRIVFAPEARATHYDSVALSWYRAKMQETARNGLPVLQRFAPDFLEETSFGDLLPVDRSRDRPARVARKLFLKAALNPVVVRTLEAWSAATDGIGWLYSPLVSRALSAGWFLEGRRMAPDGRRLVVYGG